MPQGPPIVGQFSWQGGCLSVSKALACPANLSNRGGAFPALSAAAMAQKNGDCPVGLDFPAR